MMDRGAMIGLLLALTLRWIVSLHPHSGQGKPPMFGDFEAQRHWMEITVNLPAAQWYENSTKNDLLYWGLDYPPLTAYHSYLLGKVARSINPEWVALNDSRGYESYHHKIFMRSTVFATDLLIYISALFALWLTDSGILQSSTLFLSLLSPALILIDYGHFQYNTVSLGLLLWAVVLLIKECDISAAVLFCLALNYKQMSLYYALPMFFYLLGRCLSARNLLLKLTKFTALGVSVLLIFGLLWLPYLSSSASALQVVRRIFPLNRGIYEDKVANFWYCISILIKVKNIFTESQLAYLCVVLTLSVSLPVCWMLLRKNSILMLNYSLVNVALAFFMFSFHVHEKTILFVTSALILLSRAEPFAVFWFELIATFSLQPLLIKDGLMIPYFSLMVIYIVIGHNTMKNNSVSTNWIFLVSIIGAFTLSIVSLTLRPPSRFPHLHVLLNCVYSFAHFALFSAYFIRQQYLCFSAKSTDTISKILQSPKLKKK